MDDLISRKMALDIVQNLKQFVWANPARTELRVTVDLDDVLFGLDKLTAVEAEPKWISVKDRLPDTAERVLVCKTWNGRVYKPEYGYYQDYPNQKGCWYVITEFGYYPQREVTHWMPLPQPPKGE